jgi:hypothetical protein
VRARVRGVCKEEVRCWSLSEGGGTDSCTWEQPKAATAIVEASSQDCRLASTWPLEPSPHRRHTVHATARPTECAGAEPPQQPGCWVQTQSLHVRTSKLTKAVQCMQCSLTHATEKKMRMKTCKLSRHPQRLQVSDDTM